MIGKPLRYDELSVQEVTERMVSQEMPMAFATALMVRHSREVGRALVTSEAGQILGRPAKTYADWVNDHVELFVD
ncbi:hypothetical protein C3477_11780 [Mycobacterium kansasii]|nr:hypothetical protein C3B43_02265 [Mycobacterium kansasii]POY06022.1 hypothetical protein C3477_11780 [Mycobacterium kansasii]POY16374.1 hypothetical protein C3476_23025 [Mycobacterium kansasii]POY31276.1 hypothetical protein C3478_17490 [Mycobacterium kansasii]